MQLEIDNPVPTSKIKESLLAAVKALDINAY
jgi:hypothetical protein